MKKILLCAAALAVGGTSFAQTLPREHVEGPSPDKSFTRTALIEGAVVEDVQNGTSGAEAPGDIIWKEDFSNSQTVPAGWSNTVNQGPGGWPGWEWTDAATQFSGQWTQVGEGISSTSAANGYLVLNTDGANNPNGTTEIDAELTTAAIDVSQVNGIWVEFQSKMRTCCNNDMEVEFGVYSDALLNNQLANIDVRNGLSVNTASDDPTIFQKIFVDVSTLTEIYLSWNWRLAATYYWCLDDICVREAAPDEITLDFWWYNGKDDNTEYLLFYEMVPAKQMAAHDFNLGGIVCNRGFNTQTNVALNGVIDGPVGSQNGSSTPVQSMDPQGCDSIDIDTPISGFTEDLGTYTATWSVTSDAAGTEFDPSDNIHQETWESTGIMYARDDDDITFIRARTTNEILGVYYEFPAADEITAVDIRWGANVPQGLITEGATVNVYLYNITQLTDLAQATPINVASFHEITAAEVGATAARYPLTTPLTVAAGDQIIAAVEVITETADGPWIGVTSEDPSIGQVYECVDCQFGVPAGNGWFSWNFRGAIPAIRVITSPATSLCDGVNLFLAPNSGEITYDNTTFSADISTLTPLGGATPYTFNWSGPGVSGITTPNLPALTTPGIYTCVVTDANGCTGSFDFNPDGGNLSIDKLNQADFGFGVYPNPNNGEFFLKIESATSTNYNVHVTNILGEVVHTSAVQGSGTTTEQMNLNHLGKGLYMVKISNGSVEKTQRVMIK